MSIIEKASEAAVSGGSGFAMGSGGALYLGLTSVQWSAVGVIGGLAVAFVGLIVKTWVDIYFKNQHLRLAQERAKVLADMEPEEP